jgi:ceramide glucosyltransferase
LLSNWLWPFAAISPIYAALVVLAVLAAIALVLTALADRALHRVLDATPGRASAGPRPGVSVLKPCKGIDDGLEQNLTSFTNQRYPHYEVLIGVADDADPAVAVARRVAARHPHVAIRVLVCPPDGGCNPKVSILRALSVHARFEHQLISDSNVRVGPDYLAATADELRDPRVALVTNPIVGIGDQSVGALWENLHLATFVARALSFAGVYLGRACVVGKSMLFRRDQLASIGGWALVRDVLAEDYVIGHAFQAAGYRVAVSPYVITTYNSDWSIDRFVNRHVRWGQMRRRVSLPAYLLEPLLNPTALLLAMVALSAVSGASAAVVVPAAVAGLLVRSLADRAVMARLGGTPPGPASLGLGVLKDLLVLGMWVWAGFRRTVEWRGNRFRICGGTRLEPQNVHDVEVITCSSKTAHPA